MSTEHENTCADFVIENNILKGIQKPFDANHKIGQCIFNALDESPDDISQIDADTGEQTTRWQMKDRSTRCALWMLKQGIKPDDVVVVCSENHLDSYVPMLATFFVDAVYHGWNSRIPLESARRFMKIFSPKLVFTHAKLVEMLSEAAKLENLQIKFVTFEEHLNLSTLKDILDSQTIDELGNFVPINAKSPQEVAAIMLPSASTGIQKGVMLSGNSLLRKFIEDKQSPNVSYRRLWYATPEGISCVCFTLQAIIEKDVRIVSNGIPVHSDGDSFFQLVDKYKVDFACFPPNLTNYIAKSGSAEKYDLSSLKYILIGGSRIGGKIIKALQERIPSALICQGYGATEIGGVLSCINHKSKSIDSSGFVLPNCQAKFVDLSTGKILGPNLHGEIRAKTPTMMIKYYDNPEATEEAFDEEGWYRTGDVGYYNEFGEIFIIDRIKEMIAYKNFLISPAEIEAILISHRCVRAVAVIGIAHEHDGQRPTAFVIKVPECEVTKEELLMLISHLEDYKKLAGGIHFVADLPHTGIGKIARNDLKQIAGSLIR